MTRLTKKNDKKYFKEHIACPEYNDYGQFIKDRPYRIDHYSVEVETKLGKIEDIMEKYDVKSLEELEKIISKGITYYNFIKSFWTVKGEKPNE